MGQVSLGVFTVMAQAVHCDLALQVHVHALISRHPWRGGRCAGKSAALVYMRRHKGALQLHRHSL